MNHINKQRIQLANREISRLSIELEKANKRIEEQDKELTLVKDELVESRVANTALEAKLAETPKPVRRRKKPTEPSE